MWCPGNGHRYPRGRRCFVESGTVSCSRCVMPCLRAAVERHDMGDIGVGTVWRSLQDIVVYLGDDGYLGGSGGV